MINHLTSRHVQIHISTLLELMRLLRDPDAQVRLEELSKKIDEVIQRQAQAESFEHANREMNAQLTAKKADLDARAQELATAEMRHKENTDAVAAANIVLETQRTDHQSRVKQFEEYRIAQDADFATRAKAIEQSAAHSQQQVSARHQALDAREGALVERENRVAQRERDYQERMDSQRKLWA